MGRTELKQHYTKMLADAKTAIDYANRGLALFTELKNTAAHLESEADAALTELGGSRGRGRKVELTDEDKLKILYPHKKNRPSTPTAHS